MKGFIASLYEFWKANPFISEDMGRFMRGMDIDCEYNDSHLYSWFFIGQLIGLLFFYILYYKYASSKCNQRKHLWIYTGCVLGICFLVAFFLPLYYIKYEEYCRELHLSYGDCLGFACTNLFYGFIFAIIITSIPAIRNSGHNARHTKLFGA